MQFIPYDQVKIPENRQRAEFDPAKISELADSIQKLGLFHAPIVRDGGTLVAGERRLRAVSFIYMMGGTFRYDGEEVPLGMIPVVDIALLDEFSAEEAELEENIRREDLTWQERAAASKKIHDLRTKQKARVGEVQTLVDTAIEIGRGSSRSVGNKVRIDMLVAEHLDKPEVAKAKSAEEAFKVLRSMETTAKNVALGQSIGKAFSASQHTLINGDSNVELERFGKGMFDCIITDPPYGMGADEFNNAGGSLNTLTHSYRDDEVHFQRSLDWFVPASFALSKPRAHLYVFCDIDKFAQLRSAFESAGWRVHRTPIIWHKRHAHRVPWPDHGPRRVHELILYAVKGDRRVQYIGPDVIECPLDENLGMAAQKPVGLYTELLRRSCLPGDTVLDCFCGTGPVFPAAQELKLTATGIELNQATFAIAAKRLEALKNAT